MRSLSHQSSDENNTTQSSREPFICNLRTEVSLGDVVPRVCLQCHDCRPILFLLFFFFLLMTHSPFLGAFPPVLLRRQAKPIKWNNAPPEVAQLSTAPLTTPITPNLRTKQRAAINAAAAAREPEAPIA